MSKTILMIDNYQKKKSFDLIKLIMKEYLTTLDELVNTTRNDDLFMKTTKNLLIKFNKESQELLNHSSDSLEIHTDNLNILKDTLEFYWQNGKVIYVNFSENDFIHAQKLLSSNEQKFVRK